MVRTPTERSSMVLGRHSSNIKGEKTKIELGLNFVAIARMALREYGNGQELRPEQDDVDGIVLYGSGTVRVGRRGSHVAGNLRSRAELDLYVDLRSFPRVVRPRSKCNHKFESRLMFLVHAARARWQKFMEISALASPCPQSIQPRLRSLR